MESDLVGLLVNHDTGSDDLRVGDPTIALQLNDDSDQILVHQLDDGDLGDEDGISIRNILILKD